MQDFTLHHNGPRLNNEKTGFIAALTIVLNQSDCDIKVKKKLFKKIDKIINAPNSKGISDPEKEKFFLIACTVFDTYNFLVSNHFYDFADTLYASLNKFIPQVFHQNSLCTPFQRYAVNRMARRLEVLSRVVKNHEDCKTHEELNVCLGNMKLTDFGKWGKLKRTVQSLLEEEKQDGAIIQLCDVIDNDQILVPQFKLGFQSLNKNVQSLFDETHLAIENKIKMLKEIFDGQECADLISIEVPIFFQTAMPSEIERYLKLKTYVHNNRMVVNFKLIKTDDQSENQIALSLIDISIANIKCFRRYGIECNTIPMIMSMSDKLKKINADNHIESELYIASLKKIAESFSGCIFIGAKENSSEISKVTEIYSDAMIRYFNKFNKLYEHDGVEEERHNFAEIYAKICSMNAKISKSVFDVLPQYLQDAINAKSQRKPHRSSLNSSRFFIGQPNKENKNPDDNVLLNSSISVIQPHKRRTTSR